MECDKEFIHEADRLHHARKEHEKKMFGRVHKYGNKYEKYSPSSPQDNVDKYTGHFSDKLWIPSPSGKVFHFKIFGSKIKDKVSWLQNHDMAILLS